tara:strand:+ start:193 stop:360 length:168 start_codon:yes stop_codon:yes gene_type:complete
VDRNEIIDSRIILDRLAGDIRDGWLLLSDGTPIETDLPDKLNKISDYLGEIQPET